MTSLAYCTFIMCSSLTSVVIPDSIISIDHFAFSDCSSLTHIYYTGTQSQWQSISIEQDNDNITSDKIYFYSQSQPIDTTNKYWHYDADGVTPIAW